METLSNIWNTYKGDIVPVLVSAILIVVSAVAYFVASKIKAQGVKAEAQAEKIANIDENGATSEQQEEIKSEVQQLQELIVVVKDGMVSLTDLFNTAFQNSSISPEVKEQLNNLANSIKNGVGDDVIKSLQDEVAKYKDLYDQAKKIIDDSVDKVAEVTEVKRVRD